MPGRRLPQSSAIAALVALAGCGGGSSSAGDPAALRAVRSAADVTLRARTLQFQLQSTDPLEGSLTGYEDLGRSRVELTLTRSDGTDVHVTILARAAYVQLTGKQRAQLPGHPRWGRIDLDRAPRLSPLARSLSAERDITGALVTALRGARTSRLVGTEPVDGAPARRYRVHGDLRQAIADLRPSERARYGPVLRGLEARYHARFSMDVWLDRQGRVVRERDTSGEYRTTVTLFEFDAVQAVRPPPASQTADVTPRQ